MAKQFDVFASPSAIRKIYPYLIILQHDSVESTGDVVVTPLVLPRSTSPGRINPSLMLLGHTVVLQTSNLLTVQRSRFKKPIANPAESRDRIIAAIDLLFAGS